MRSVTMITALGLAAMMGAGGAQAAPMVAPAAPAATLQTAVDTGPAPALELVRGGCGFGAHLTYHGYCHLNHGIRGRVRARHRFFRHHRFY